MLNHHNISMKKKSIYTKKLLYYQLITYSKYKSRKNFIFFFFDLYIKWEKKNDLYLNNILCLPLLSLALIWKKAFIIVFFYFVV